MLKTDPQRSLLLYGNFEWDALASSYQRAFELLGHRVTPMDTRSVHGYLAPWLSNRLLYRLSIKNMGLRRIATLKWNEYLIQLSRETRPALIFILNGEYLMPESLLTLREEGIPCFVFHPDNPFPPFPNQRPETLPVALASTCYLIWSRSLVERLKKTGIQRAEYLPFAWDPEVFPYDSKDKGVVENDLVFIGGWDDEREKWLTPLSKQFNLKIWGPPYWKNRTRLGSPLRISYQGHALRSREASQVLRRSRIVLNVLRKQNLPDGVIMRTFEVPGSGGFSLSTRTGGALEIFSEPHAGAYFGTLDECIKQVNYYLAHEVERNDIAQMAHHLVKNHQYVDRARQIMEIYESLAQVDQ